ncbi:MAG: XdhC family protein [Alphaproteobacteria bacterium]|nr:XdhC family protein [Alphaproteobacteria bacterium]
MNKNILDLILKALENKTPIALVSELKTGNQGIVYEDRVSGLLKITDDITELARTSISDDSSRRSGDFFIQVFNPPKRLIIVGAVHIAQPLVEIGKTAGFSVIIVDPRGAFATGSRFPNVDLNEDWPDEALISLGVDNRTAVVTLTHDPKLDDPALEVALRTNAFYIGSLGSKKTHSKRIERLKESGFDEHQISRIHGPIGLDIGSKSPAEIAISIMAEITKALHAT